MNLSKLEFSNKVFKISGDQQLLTRLTTKITTDDPLDFTLELTGLLEFKQTDSAARTANKPHLSLTWACGHPGETASSPSRTLFP